MVEINDPYFGAARPARSLGRWTRRLIGVACLIAIPAIWIAMRDAFPEARVLGLALSVILMGGAGLCFIRQR